MNRLGLGWAWLVSLGLLGVNGYYIIANREDWPFSACPMFGHPHHPKQTRYLLTWMLVDAQGERAIRGPDIGQRHHAFGRFFFNRVWGSSDLQSLQGSFPADTPAQLEDRVSRYAAALMGELRRVGRAPPSGAHLRLDLITMAPDDRETARRSVGDYDPATRRFTWKAP